MPRQDRGKGGAWPLPEIVPSTAVPQQSRGSFFTKTAASCLATAGSKASWSAQKRLPLNPESRDRLKLDERWNFALPRPELPQSPAAKVPAKETSAGPAVQCQ
ncbi:MAG: hypothetical protein WCQ77_08050, partial [Planctomycetota bacterium]